MTALFEAIKQSIMAHPYLSLFFTTFISEDAAFFYALFSHELNSSNLAIAYIGGILVGDTVLYFLGYLSRVLHTRFFLKKVPTDLKKIKHVESMDIWLMMTRFLPGTRLLTYTYLGYQNYSIVRFIGILCLATFFQISIGFGFVNFFAHQFNIEKWLHKALVALCAMVCSILVFKSIVFILKWKDLSIDAFKVKLIAYYRLIYKEFWPSLWMYSLMIPGFIYLIIKYRGFSYFLYCNPAIINSGIVGESKDDLDKLLQAIPKKFLLAQVMVEKKSTLNFSDLKQLMHEKNIQLPCYVKPILGHRGLMVKRINTEEELKEYSDIAQFDFLIQELCSAQEEMGLYFLKKEGQFSIFSITDKKFPYVIGDGKKSLKQLIMKDSYLKLFSPNYFKKHWNNWNTVLKNNEKFFLTDTGNHNQGCIFKNGIRYNNENLRIILNAILNDVKGINIGRFDLKYNLNGNEIDEQSIKIIELNGGSAEPTHIYDKDTSLFEMFSSLFQQYDYMFQVGKKNYQKEQVAWNTKSFLKDWLAYIKQTKHY
ncbi:MAG TPA: hypothetical protein PKC21_08145 [Oligoflexia bacterium]|nr:hypothetical protein [Oligoflexia bacterium]HMR25309.1 hypothetical protein [Oligoflexia bacterium]